MDVCMHVCIEVALLDQFFFCDPVVLESICYRTRVYRFINESNKTAWVRKFWTGSWIAHEKGRPTGPGREAHQKWVQCPNPTGTIGPASRTLALACTLCVLSAAANFTLGS